MCFIRRIFEVDAANLIPDILSNIKDLNLIKICTQMEMKERKVHPEGVEPPTLWSEARCSIH